MEKFQHKKRFGQNFLKDMRVAQRIVESFTSQLTSPNILEIGPGEGALTQFLIQHPNSTLYISEIDRELIPRVQEKFPIPDAQWLIGDFLKVDLRPLGPDFALIGNFPYNISTQIIFRVLEERERIPLMVGMFQREVAQRIACTEGSKVYGITSVLTQAFYHVEYLFTVSEGVFQPPPSVKSAVIRLTRKPQTEWPAHPNMLFKVVKAGFNQRRKTLRNALKSLNLPPEKVNHAWADKRAEQLSVADFNQLVQFIVAE